MSGTLIRLRQHQLFTDVAAVYLRIAVTWAICSIFVFFGGEIFGSI